ncbi:glycosyltransferase family 4 protein [Aliarcobacter butzleri]|uniref:glycosyltransferase family 4 protein n=1 Tax=Aliarcobacter butzleri TaxID=28197 RepID=UPI0021B2D8A9|nr:glycosyltransferase family 4 protein [Aliarcobacter butzleri]MCT7618083.1 glycosyltransferase family 4 protein [Aliarcobacter butzleri]
MKNILEVCLSPDYGGLELHMKDLTKFLKVKAVINKNGKLKNKFDNEEIPYFEMGRFNFIKLAKIIDINDIDVVHLQWTKDIPIAVLAKLISKKNPKIIQTRNMHMTRFKDDFYHKFLYKNIDTIIGISKKVSEQLIKFIPDDVRPKIITWYNGVPKPKIIDVDRKNEIKRSFGLKNEFIVCIVARVEETKGQHIVLDAVEKLRISGINAKALIVGHYMDKKYFEELQKKYKNDIFTGFANNANELIQISDCKVMATRNETFGMAIMDAMRCGICVLGSDSGGPLESIDNMKTGLHFKTMDSDDLYKKLLMIAKNNEFKNSLAIAGKIKADEFFDSEKQFNELECILTNI